MSSLPGAEDHGVVIGRLASVIKSTLADLIPSDTRFALVDFPYHSNIGDSAIYAGELAYLDSRGLRASYVTTARPPSAADTEMGKAIGDGPIYLHGGGNFGDLWPYFQAYRERVIAMYPGRPIVQFPQTLYFSSPQKVGETARIIERHGAFTLLVRDQRSFELAQRSFQCDVRLCPDMAFCLGPQPRTQPTTDLLLHLRKDKEAARQHDVAGILRSTDAVQADWPREPPNSRRRVKLEALLSTVGTGGVFGGIQRLKELYFRKLTQKRLMRGMALLGSGRTVVTDRLHGHIISFLMGLPHCVLDNSYGKTSSFMNTWHTTSGNRTYTADNVEEAVQLLAAHEGLRVAAH
jgi:pyruvyl transferase EpsO